MESFLYEGWVRHRRLRPTEHAFAYPVFLLYLDLDEVSDLFRWRGLRSTRPPAVLRFRRADYLGDPERPLAEAVRDRVEQETGRRPAGPVRLLTHVRTFGYVFNPISMYYCFDSEGERLQAIVADVTNTPWKERHSYVLTPAAANGGAVSHRFQTRKQLHVSPFMRMDQNYRWHVGRPGTHLVLGIENLEQGRRLFSASLALRRRPLTGLRLAGALARYPFLTLRVTAGIYWQAFRLRRKHVPVHPHPREHEAKLEPALR